jgi:integrase
MATVKYYTKNQKADRSVLRLYFNYNGKVLKYSTKINVEQRLWDKNRQRMKRQAINSSEINKTLYNIEQSILSIYHNAISNDVYIDNTYLRDKLDLKLNRIEKEDFFSYWENYMLQKSELAKSTKSDYNQCLNTLKRFEKYSKFKIQFETINLDFYSRFKHFLLDVEQHAINTFGKRIKVIKSVMNYATEIGVNTNLDYQKKSFKVLSKKKKHQYLNINEVTKLENTPLMGKEDKARDIFLLFCFLGIRYGDYKQIIPSNISLKGNQYYLDIIMNKVKNPISIPLNQNTVNILKKWNFKLPYLSNNDVNKYIKSACKKAEINEVIIENDIVKKKYELISCHSGRRSFATNGYISNIPIKSLMSITGHKKESTFYNYVQIKRNTELTQILSIYPNKLRKVS